MSEFRTALSAIIAGGLTSFSFGSYGQQIIGIKIDQTRVGIGVPVAMQVDFNLNDVPNPYCGLEINFGDGNSQEIRAGYNGQKDFPFTLSHAYPNAGSYVVKVAGKYVSRGLRSASACTGDVRQVNVMVVNEAAERAKDDAQRSKDEFDRKSRELAAKEAELRQLADRLDRERKTQDRKAQEQRAQPRINEDRGKKSQEVSPMSKPQGEAKTKSVVDPF